MCFAAEKIIPPIKWGVTVAGVAWIIARLNPPLPTPRRGTSSSKSNNLKPLKRIIS
jgi:hypothetical protein